MSTLESIKAKIIDRKHIPSSILSKIPRKWSMGVFIENPKIFSAIFVRCDREIATDYSFTCLLRFMSVVVCCCLCVWDGRKLEFLSRAQSDWAETFWRPWVGIPN
jgi:hypothetical protein